MRRMRASDLEETDPRFLARRIPAIGRDMRGTDRGSHVRLSGRDAGSHGKLLKVSGLSDSSPWLAAVSSVYSGYVGGGAGPTAGVWASGIIGSGAATVPVIFDAKPDVNIQLPGDSVDIDVSWAPTYLAISATEAPPSIVLSQLPEFADVSAVACRGTSSRGAATYTQRFITGVAGVYQFKLPPFADRFMAYAPAANYAFLTQIDFTTNDVAATGQIITTYTSAQILAIRDAGGTITIPGNAAAFRVTTSAGTNFWLSSILSL